MGGLVNRGESDYWKIQGLPPLMLLREVESLTGQFNVVLAPIVYLRLA